MRNTKENQIAIKNDKGEIILATGKFVGKKTWMDFDSAQHNTITIRNLTTKKSATFDFWGSRVNPSAQNRKGVVDALYCFASDSSAAMSCTSFEDFCNEFDYDEDSRKAEKVYQGCQKLYEKFDRVIGASSENMDSLYSLGDEDYNTLVEEGKVLLNY